MTDPDALARRRRGSWAFLLSPGWIAAALAALAFAATCFLLLAPWQFSRHEERSAQNAAIQAAVAAAPVPATELLNTAGQPPQDALWRVVTATGSFDPGRQVQVRLRQDANGNPVSEVITPFRLESGQWLLVDRGYVRFADVSNNVPVPPPPTGQVTISGRVQDEQTDPLNRQPLAVQDRVEAYAINVAAVGGARPSEEFLQGYLQLTEGSAGALTPIDVPQTDAGPFLSYALQWEAFGVIALVGFGIFVYREVVAPRPPDDRDADGGEPDAVMSVHPAPPSVSTETTSPVPAGRQRRRARDGFDRSQLYDE